jgi:hypothetical protein
MTMSAWRDERTKVPRLAYDAPPVYVPLSKVSKEAQTCVNDINQYDGLYHSCAATQFATKWQ